MTAAGGPDDVIVAQARAEAARAQLFRTLGQVQNRIKPAHLAHDAVQGAKQGLASVASRGTEAARARPVAAAAVAGVVGLIVSRRWIRRWWRRRDETRLANMGLEDNGAMRATKGSTT